MKLADFAHMFRNQRDEDEAERAEVCRQALDWMGASYHKRFLTWLEENGLKEIPLSGNHMDLVQSTVRCNTFREIRAHLLRLERESIATLEKFKESE